MRYRYSECRSSRACGEMDAYETETLRCLLDVLNTQALIMLDSAINRALADPFRMCLLKKVLEVRMVQREVWLAAQETNPCTRNKDAAAAAACNMGVCYALLGNMDKSSELLNTALQEVPENGTLCMYIQDYIRLSELYVDKASGAATPEATEPASDSQEVSPDDIVHAEDILTTELMLRRVVALLEADSDED